MDRSAGADGATPAVGAVWFAVRNAGPGIAPADLPRCRSRSSDVLTMYPAASTIPEMIERLRTLPAPPTVEQRDVEELPERPGL